MKDDLKSPELFSSYMFKIWRNICDDECRGINIVKYTLNYFSPNVCYCISMNLCTVVEDMHVDGTQGFH